MNGKLKVDEVTRSRVANEQSFRVASHSSSTTITLTQNISGSSARGDQMGMMVDDGIDALAAMVFPSVTRPVYGVRTLLL
jgi:hypothetical protein